MDQFVAEDTASLTEEMFYLTYYGIREPNFEQGWVGRWWLYLVAGMVIGIDPLVDFACKQLLELPKYALPRHNGVILDPLEQWCFFFRTAQYLSPLEIARRLPDPVFSEAVGVLEMISQDALQRHFYELRMKLERNVRADWASAQEAGLEQGIEQARY